MTVTGQRGQKMGRPGKNRTGGNPIHSMADILVDLLSHLMVINVFWQHLVSKMVAIMITLALM